MFLVDVTAVNGDDDVLWHTQHTIPSVVASVLFRTFVQNVVSFVRDTPGSVDPQYGCVRCGGFAVRLCAYPSTRLSWFGYPSVPEFVSRSAGTRSAPAVPPLSPAWQ